MHSLTWFMHGKLDIMIYFRGGAFFPPPWQLSFAIFGMGLHPWICIPPPAMKFPTVCLSNILI